MNDRMLVSVSGLSHGVALATDMARIEQWTKYGGAAFSRILDAPELTSVADVLSDDLRGAAWREYYPADGAKILKE